MTETNKQQKFLEQLKDPFRAALHDVVIHINEVHSDFIELAFLHEYSDGKYSIDVVSKDFETFLNVEQLLFNNLARSIGVGVEFRRDHFDEGPNHTFRRTYFIFRR